MKSSGYYKASGYRPLGLTFEGTGSGSAYLYDNVIYVTLTAAQQDKYVKIEIPFKLRVVDQFVIGLNSTSAAAKVGNDTTDIATVAATGADKALKRATAIDDAQWNFDKDDDDLYINVATGAATVFTGITILPR